MRPDGAKPRIVLRLGISLSLPVGPAADYHSMIEVSNPPASAANANA